MKKFLVAALVVAALIPASAFAREPKIAPSTPRQFTSSMALPGVGGVEATIVATEADKARAESSISSALSDASSKAGAYTSEARSINEQPAKTPVEVSTNLAIVLQRCKDYSALTKGAFDITGTGAWKKIKVSMSENNSTVTRKNDAAVIDPTIFAMALKGFLADSILENIQSQGWANVQVVIGNVTRSIGRDIHTPWSVRIDAPTAAEQGKFAFRAYNYSVGNVATAKISPALYPTGGTEPQVINAVIFANDAATAVSYAMAAYVNSVKDAQKGMSFIKSKPEVRGIVIALDGTMLSSEELAINHRQPAAAATGNVSDTSSGQE